MCLCLISPRHTASVEAFDKQMAVNARSVMLCYKHAAKQMIAQGQGGRIIGQYAQGLVCTCASISKAHIAPLRPRRIFHGRQAR